MDDTLGARRHVREDVAGRNHGLVRVDGGHHLARREFGRVEALRRFRVVDVRHRRAVIEGQRPHLTEDAVPAHVAATEDRLGRVRLIGRRDDRNVRVARPDGGEGERELARARIGEGKAERTARTHALVELAVLVQPQGQRRDGRRRRAIDRVLRDLVVAGGGQRAARRIGQRGHLAGRVIGNEGGQRDRARNIQRHPVVQVVRARRSSTKGRGSGGRTRAQRRRRSRDSRGRDGFSPATGAQQLAPLRCRFRRAAADHVDIERHGRLDAADDGLVTVERAVDLVGGHHIGRRHKARVLAANSIGAARGRIRTGRGFNLGQQDAAPIPQSHRAYSSDLPGLGGL